MGKFGETDDGKWIIKTEIRVDFFAMQKTNYGIQNIDFEKKFSLSLEFVILG